MRVRTLGKKAILMRLLAPYKHISKICLELLNILQGCQEPKFVFLAPAPIGSLESFLNIYFLLYFLYCHKFGGRM